MISFDDGTMIVPDEELAEVAEAVHAVVREAKDAGVWVTGGGLMQQSASVVATAGTITQRPYPETKAIIGGFSIVDVTSHGEACDWAARIVFACRCAQEVRELGDDPEA